MLGALLAVVVGQALLANGQVRLSALQQQLSLEQSGHRQSELAVAELETPARIVAAATGQLGMVRPDIGHRAPVRLPLHTPSNPEGDAGAGVATGAGHLGHCGWWGCIRYCWRWRVGSGGFCCDSGSGSDSGIGVDRYVGDDSNLDAMSNSTRHEPHRAAPARVVEPPRNHARPGRRRGPHNRRKPSRSGSSTRKASPGTSARFGSADGHAGEGPARGPSHPRCAHPAPNAESGEDGTAGASAPTADQDHQTADLALPYRLVERHVPRRVRVVRFILLIAMLLLVARLVDVQVLHAGSYQAQARGESSISVSLPSLRGGIYARDGSPLALSVPTDDVVADDYQVAHPVKTALALSPMLHVPATTLAEELHRPTGYVVLAKQLPQSTGQQISADAIPGITPDRRLGA